MDNQNFDTKPSDKFNKAFFGCISILIVLALILLTATLFMLRLPINIFGGIAGEPTPTATRLIYSTHTPILANTQAATEKSSGVEIAVLNVNTTVLPDGTVENSANLSLSPLGLGSLHLSSPSKIKLGESSVIRLTITPNSVLSGLPQVSAPTVSAGGPGYVLEFSDELQIYPVMIAELWGINFEILSDNQPEKPVVSSMAVEWLWNVTPTSPGKQSLFLVISVPVIIDETSGVVSAQALKNIPIEIEVEVTATPIPSATLLPTTTPTPLPPLARVKEQIINNSVTVITSVLALIGVLVGALVNYLINRSKSQSENNSNIKRGKKKK